MNKPKTHTLSINMDLSEDYSSCRCAFIDKPGFTKPKEQLS